MQTQNDLIKGHALEDKETPYSKSRQLIRINHRWSERHTFRQTLDLNDGECQRAMYTLTDDGTIYAEWDRRLSI